MIVRKKRECVNDRRLTEPGADYGIGLNSYSLKQHCGRENIFMNGHDNLEGTREE
jgi:hypothetical protein